jgi:hypothetical protein
MTYPTCSRPIRNPHLSRNALPVAGQRNDFVVVPPGYDVPRFRLLLVGEELRYQNEANLEIPTQRALILQSRLLIYDDCGWSCASMIQYTADEKDNFFNSEWQDAVDNIHAA